ncbi:MAG: hypothetical protein C4529_09840 [Deltaproteobacteria bacterium]|nr:MAG: hypothetical protein C4529_09840 [Deltaproteobacteria bacterium]
MFLLRREFHDGAERPEIVYLHAEVAPEGGAAGTPERTTLVVAPAGSPGRREAYIRVPEPGGAGRFVVRYRFSVVRGGEERCSPFFEVAVPSDDALPDLFRIPEDGEGNLRPAPGRGCFRMVLPLAEGERAGGVFRYGFGAMRKKASPSLCRASVDAGNGPAPVVWVPESLSVLKGRPMPYYLYHLSECGELRADKIACMRVVLRDPEGEIVSARLVWGDSSWRASNVTAMEAKRPGVFEGYVFGPSGGGVEYCFQLLSRRKSGATEAGWRNREGGGNWGVTL